MSRKKSRWLAAALFMVFAAVLAMGLFRALGFKNVGSDAEPYAQSGAGFDYSPWDQALQRWVREGRVDYDRVLQDREVLSRFVATLAVIGPRTTPQLFPTKDDELAYYVNAYNALVLHGVVSHWPINTVHDVRGAFEPKAGFGFFYGLRFLLDGKRVNLYNFEHKMIRGYNDARIHAAINCASGSCPALAPFAFTSSKLNEQLSAVTRAFCAPPHVVVDDATKSIQLSSIFDWYRGDFEAHAKALGADATIADFIEAFASEPISAAIRRAQADGYTTSFTTYDWRLNRL